MLRKNKMSELLMFSVFKNQNIFQKQNASEKIWRILKSEIFKNKYFCFEILIFQNSQKDLPEMPL